MKLLNDISGFASQWLGTALPSIFLLFLGILLCLLVTAAVWDRRIRSLGASFGISLGLLMAAVALTDGLSAFWGEMDLAIRMRLTAGVISLGMLLLTGISAKRSGLHVRYTVLWTSVSLLVLLTAVFPQPLAVFPSVLGVQYGTAVAVLALLFLLLHCFHISIVISNLEEEQKSLVQRLSRLETRIFDEDISSPLQARTLAPEKPFTTFCKLFLREIPWPQFPGKVTHGTTLTAPLFILLAVGAVFTTGMLAPQVMVGDEVTHFYMMKTQAHNLFAPNFFAEIPTGWGEIETRRYPHSFLWHYFAAVLFKLSNGSFLVIQLYQALFLGQLLWVAFRLAGDRGGIASRSALLYLLLIASLPMTLIFSVVFYQDVPMTAQVLTSFYLLRKNRWLLATMFLCLALGLKVTAILFFPAFYCCLTYWTLKRHRLPRALLVVLVSLVLSGGFTWSIGKTIEHYGGAKFYPVEQFERICDQFSKLFQPNNRHGEQNLSSQGAAANKSVSVVPSEQEAEIIANHPGDLRIPMNFLIYGGLLLYLSMASALLIIVSQFWRRRFCCLHTESSFWLWSVGISYLLLVLLFLKTAPDARFFLPGLVFLMLPIAERLVCLPKSRFIVMTVTTLALMQSGYALAKTYHLRRVTPELQAAIHFLQDHRPTPGTIFMYPEGNYRLFPTPHNWYLNYYLRDFWRAGNNQRLAMLQKNRIGAIVIKKHLISNVDEKITNLGVYPINFVKDISSDSRFVRVFDNSAISIYQVPSGGE